MSNLRPTTRGDKVFCGYCNEFHKFIRVAQAAKVVSMDRRSIYGHISRGWLYAFKVCGGVTRVCTGCLVRPIEVPRPEGLAPPTAKIQASMRSEGFGTVPGERNMKSLKLLLLERAVN